MQKKYVEAVIFDLDGTLIDSKKDIIDSMNFILISMGLDKKPDAVIQGYIGHGRDKLIADSLGREATPQMIVDADRNFDIYYRQHMFDHTKLFPSALGVLDYLKEKNMMVVTNKNLDLTLATLKHFKIEQYFHRVIGGDDKNCRKPDSCPIENLLHSVKVNKDKAIIVGDSEIDIKAGKLAGILTCAVTSGIGSIDRIEAALPDYTIDDIRKLKDIIC